MPIPEFTDHYFLPPGEHEASLAETQERFGTGSQKRIEVWEDFESLLSRMRKLGLVPDEILIDGSFVTGRADPGDVDCAMLIPPEMAEKACGAADKEDSLGAQLFLNTQNQVAIRCLFGAHLLLAPDRNILKGWSFFFRKGKGGKLSEKDPLRDPDWVTVPDEKGIIKITGTNIQER